MQLTPREYFTIARGLEDHTITTTFYVRAFIRNARTDELIDTIDLTDSGDHHRYTKPWQVPADVSGQGFYILITTSVYTDSAYTTKSTDYADRYDEHLVMDRFNANLSGHGASGPDVDYKKIEKMISTAIGTIPKSELPERVDVAPVVEQLGQIKDLVTSVKDVCVALSSKQMPKLDLSPVLAELRGLEGKLKIGEAMELSSKNLKEIGASINEAFEDDRDKLVGAIESMERMLERIKDFFGPEVDGIVKGMEELKAEFDRINHVVILDKEKAKESAI